MRSFSIIIVNLVPFQYLNIKYLTISKRELDSITVIMIKFLSYEELFVEVLCLYKTYLALLFSRNVTLTKSMMYVDCIVYICIMQCSRSGPIFSDPNLNPDSLIRFWIFESGFFLEIPNLFGVNKIVMQFLTWFNLLVTVDTEKQ